MPTPKEITYTAEQVFGSDKIKEWTEGGHWPPPPGMTVLPEIVPDPKAVEKYQNLLLNSLSESQRKALIAILAESANGEV